MGRGIRDDREGRRESGDRGTRENPEVVHYDDLMDGIRRMVWYRHGYYMGFVLSALVSFKRHGFEEGELFVVFLHGLLSWLYLIYVVIW